MENKITIEQAVEIKNKVNHMCGLDIIDIYVYNRVHDEVEFYVNGWLISFTDVKSAIEKRHA